MKILLSVPLICLTFLLCGCDGHLRSFRVASSSHTQTAKQAPHTITIIRSIAFDHGFKEEVSAGDEVARFSRQVDQNHSIYISLTRETTDTYIIRIFDWPSIVRSDQSKALESEIRNQLQKQRHAEQGAAANPYQPHGVFVLTSDPLKTHPQEFGRLIGVG